MSEGRVSTSGELAFIFLQKLWLILNNITATFFIYGKLAADTFVYILHLPRFIFHHTDKL